MLTRLEMILAAHPLPIELIDMRAPSHCRHKTLQHLREVLPLGAEFLERHPNIGSSHSKRNALGGPLGRHLIGVCHSVERGTLGDLATILDVFPFSARLTLCETNLAAGAAIGTSDEALDEYLIEALVLGTDMMHFETTRAVRDAPSAILEAVWQAQAADGASETYALCGDIAAGKSELTAQHDVQPVALALRERYARWHAAVNDHSKLKAQIH